MTERQYTHDDHPTFRDDMAQEHTKRLTGYRALLAEFETMVGDAQLEANATEGGNPNTASAFTDDLRFLIALSEEIVNKFRPHPPGELPIADGDAPQTPPQDEGQAPR